MKSRFKKSIILLLVAVMMLSLAGCKKEEVYDDPLMNMDKQTLVNKIYELNEQKMTAESDLSTVRQEYEDYKNTVAGAIGSEDEKAAITEVGDGTHRLTFNSFDGVIELPNEFMFPGSTQAPNTSSININQSVSISPTSVWTSQIDGTTLELYHSLEISGVIKIGYLDTTARREASKVNVQDYAETNLLNGFPASNFIFKDLYVGTNKNSCGKDITGLTTIDEEKATIRCGLMALGDTSVQYFFVYKGDSDSIKDDAVLSLLRTMKIGGKELSIQ